MRKFFTVIIMSNDVRVWIKCHLWVGHRAIARVYICLQVTQTQLGYWAKVFLFQLNFILLFLLKDRGGASCKKSVK